MLGEGGELKYDTNINFLLEEYGIMVNSGACPNLSNTLKVWSVFCCVNIKLAATTPILFPPPPFTADAVVRNVYYKYFHPKEALVSNGVLNRLVGCHSCKVSY